MALDTQTNVDKEINEGILRTYLGIDDPTGIDFGTYKTLLREKIAAARMGSSDMDSSDISYLTNEFLRIKNIEPAKTKKIDINKFVKKAEEKKKETKVSAQKLFEAASETASTSAPKAGKVSNQKLLPPSRITPTPQDEVDDFYGQDLDDLLNEIRNDKEETQSVIDDLKKESEEQKKILNMLTPSFSSMEENLESILAINKDQTKTKEKNLKQKDKEEQVTSRKSREAQLESKAPKLKSVDKLEDTTKKVGGFMDMLLTFLGNILAGGAITGLMNILENPLRIFNPVITFVNGFIESFNNLLTDIFEVFRSPVQGVIDGLNSAGSFLLEQLNKALGFFNMEPMEGFGPIPDFEVFQIPKIELIDPPEIPDDTDTKPKIQGLSGGGETEISPATTPTQGEEITNSSGAVSSPTNNTKPFSGEVKQTSGVASKGMGVDNRQVAVQGGEVIFANSAVNYWGKDFLLSMNKIGGGTNRPQTRMGETGFRGGGMVSGGYISDDERAALDVLAKYESGSDGYQAVNQYGDKAGRGNVYRFSDGSTSFAGSFNKMSMHKGRSLTDLTVGEVKQLQYDDGSLSMRQWVDQGKLHAVGRYQFVGNTLPGVAKRAGIPDTAKFDKTTQDKMAIQLIKERGISPWVGPSDKATPAERAIVAKVRNMAPSTTMSRPSQIASSPSTPSTSSTPAAKVSSPDTSSKTMPPPPPVKKKPLAVIAAAGGGGSAAGSQSSSASNAGQTRVDGFSSIDLNNPELIVIKSIYNVVG